LGTFLYFLEKEVKLSSQHVRLFDGVHAPLAWFETFIIPTLVGHHLLDQSLALSMVSEKKAPPAAASMWSRAVGVNPL
jgi:hypothetical protein